MGDMRVNVGCSFLMQHFEDGQRNLVYCYAAKALSAYKTKLLSKVRLNKIILS